MTYTIFLRLEPYLAQWLRHECGGDDPIRLRRGSAEADILYLHLQPQPRRPDYRPQLRPAEGEVEIALPWFKYKDIRTYNYLPPRAATLLRECIRTRFRVNFWHDIFTVSHLRGRIDLHLEAWMDSHGIEVDDRNYNTLQKIHQRKRAVYCPDARLRRRAPSSMRPL